MKHTTVTKMNTQVSNSKPGPWFNHACKESALVGRAKKLAPKVNSICKVLELDPDNTNVIFANVKTPGLSMFDCITLVVPEKFSLSVEFHNASKNTPAFVRGRVIAENVDVEIETPTWKELKGVLPTWVEESLCGAEEPTDEEPECEHEEEDKAEDCDGYCAYCNDSREDFDPEEVEDKVEEEEEELPFEDELDNTYNDED